MQTDNLIPGLLVCNYQQDNMKAIHQIGTYHIGAKQELPSADSLRTTRGQAYHRRGSSREAQQHPRQTVSTNRRIVSVFVLSVGPEF